MSNNSSIREQLTFKAGLQIFLSLVAIIFASTYVLPTFWEINRQTAATNAAIENFKNIENFGLNVNQIKNIASQEKNYNELKELLNSTEAKEVQNAIQKTGNEPYLKWIDNEVAWSHEAKKALSDEKAKINSIIPTLSPINQNINEDTVTLRDYIAYFEENILRKFSIQSFSPLGITGIKYPNEKDGKKSSDMIGAFQVELTFDNTTVTNISKLLNFIHETGKPTILSQSETLGSIPKAMSNPLITVQSLSITEAIDPKFPNKELSGKLTLNFYIRGSSETDKMYLIDSFNKQKSDLAQKIANRISTCAEKCPESHLLLGIQKKFNEFNTSFHHTLNSQGNNSVESMYLLSQQLQSIKAITEEFENIK